MTISISITEHTTTSSPRPHVLYTILVTAFGRAFKVYRRFSQFLALHEILGDEFLLPEKRLVNSFVPLGWVDDELVSERKIGLSKYLTSLLWSPEYQKHPALLNFLSPGEFSPATIDLKAKSPSPLFQPSGIIKRPLRAANERRPLVATYYFESSVDDAPPEMLDYRKFDVIFFGFAFPDSSFTLSWSPNSEAVLKRLIRTARLRNAQTKIVLSIGGSNGSEWFSQACSTSTNRVAFVSAIAAAVKQHALDGVDINWEHPNSKSAGIPSMPEDTENLLKFLQSLRSALGTSKIISAVVGHTTWLGRDKVPLADVSAFAEVLDLINVANYGAWGVLPYITPNAPLGTSSVQNGASRIQDTGINAQSAIQRWQSAGFPASKILLGLPLFAYVTKSNKTSLEAPTSGLSAKNLRLKPIVGTHAIPSKLNKVAEISAWWGKPVAFNTLVKGGILVKQFDGNYAQGSGFTMGWDDPSSTPYLFNAEKATLITFDNARSLAAKAKFATQSGLAGCFTWSLDQDDGTTMHDVIRGALGT